MAESTASTASGNEKSGIQTHVRQTAGSGASSLNTLPGRNIAYQPPSRYNTRHSLNLDDYFAGPRDMAKHSKMPFFMRVHGSVLPKMIVPIAFVGAWATLVTLISRKVTPLEVNSILLTVLGFVVSFAISFRCSTAYERYGEGRKYWAQLTLTSRNLARGIWVHVQERQDSDELAKADLLGKLTAIQLINAFAVALKHRLRFEPAADYADMAHLVCHLDSMAINADQDKLKHKEPSKAKAIGEHLGIPFAQSNPRKLIKRARDNLGNLPLEILNHLESYLETVISTDKLMPTVCTQNLAITDIRTMADILTGTERILNTPLPLAYSISISQITWAYIFVLPFQLVKVLEWVTIPGTMVAAYIILGLAIIGREIENPFGNDVNDLPLEEYCREIAADLDVLTSMPAPRLDDFVKSKQNLMLSPFSFVGYNEWEGQSVADIRLALKAKATSDAKQLELVRTKSAAASNTAPQQPTSPRPQQEQHVVAEV